MSSPEVSVVIPSHARPDRLHDCLNALSLTSHRSFEVVVVDDGSPESLQYVVDRFAGQLELTFVRQSNAGPAAARNRGVAAARANMVAFTDDDCLPEPQWVTEITSALKENPHALVGGATFNALKQNIYSETSQDLLSFLYEWAEQEGRGFHFFASNNLACCKAAFMEIGGFDETFPLAAGEDRDFGLRWNDKGWPLLFQRKAVMGHAHNLSLARFWRQQSNYGRGAKHLRNRRIVTQNEPVRFEGLKFYSDLLTFPLRHNKPNALRRMALLFLSQVATVAGYFSQMGPNS